MASAKLWETTGTLVSAELRWDCKRRKKSQFLTRTAFKFHTTSATRLSLTLEKRFLRHDQRSDKATMCFMRDQASVLREPIHKLPFKICRRIRGLTGGKWLCRSSFSSIIFTVAFMNFEASFLQSETKVQELKLRLKYQHGFIMDSLRTRENTMYIISA